MIRHDGRETAQLRPVEIVRGYTQSPAGSVLVRAGRTIVLCTASWQPGVPEWRKDSGSGWVTAEYDMLPAATDKRRPRNRTKIDGRTQEIQRLIGRSLRAVVDMAAMGENSILIDCDVLQADGGTRTASINGAYVAMCDAVRFAIKNGALSTSPVRGAVAAISVGMAKGQMLVDLDYREDVAAEVDMNVVMTGDGRFVEVQGTGEQATFSQEELDRMLQGARHGIECIIAIQADALRKPCL